MFKSIKKLVNSLFSSNQSVEGIDPFGLKGEMEITHIKKNGDIITFKKQNLVVDGGLDLICDCLGKATGRPAPFASIGVGSGNLAPTNGNTALVAEIKRNVGVYNHTAGTNYFTFRAEFAENEAIGALQEAGIFNDMIAGTMFNKITFPVINKETDDGLIITFKITFSRV